MKKYANKVSIAGCYGKLYLFELNKNRTGLFFDSPLLSDKIANNPKELQKALFGE